MAKEKINFCTYIRVVAMIMILLCHIVQQHSCIYVQMTSQFFNIGVQIFFILSGFLMGTQKEITNVYQWYKKRVSRIYIPWILFVCVLTIVHWERGIYHWNKDWVLLFLGLQGTEVGIEGAGQTWFITELLLCYLITPILTKYKHTTLFKSSVFFLIFLPLILLIDKLHNYSTWVFALIAYISSFYIGYKYRESWICRCRIPWALSGACGAIIARILFREYMDGTILYESIIVGYTQIIIAICIIYSIAAFCLNLKPGKISTYLSNISFEVYLYHYMLCAGPICLYQFFPNWYFATIVLLLTTLGISSIMAYTYHCFTNYHQ